MKKLLAIVLCAAILAGATFIPAAATNVEQPTRLNRLLLNVGDFAVITIVNILTALTPAPRTTRTHITPAEFLPGHDVFLDEPAADAQWHLGYARASLIPEGWFCEDGYWTGPEQGIYVAGNIEFLDAKVPTNLLDDMVVRATAMHDDSGRGVTVFASVDAYALTSPNVRRIRRQVMDWATANDIEIVSINVAAIHQHSVIDTLGMNASILGALFVNPLNALLRNPLNVMRGWFATDDVFRHHGTDAAFMAHFNTTTAATIIAAIENLEPGTLYYGYADATDLLYAKRRPHVTDENMHRFRFVPNDTTSRETWLANHHAHSTGLGAGPLTVTGDWSYYTEHWVNTHADANFQLILGAISAVARHFPEGTYIPDERVQNMINYGEMVAQRLDSIANETLVEPILNIRHAEYRIPITNPLHQLLFRTGMVETTAVRRNLVGVGMDIVTEAAYMELGTGLAVVFAPGEVCPAVMFGPSIPGSIAYSGRDFEFTPLAHMARGGRRTIMFGVINDHSGYYQLPNDIMHFVRFGNEEINQSSNQAAQRLLTAMEELIAGIDCAANS
ncbi:MAG: hypothetical protein FWD06_10960 [Oscillospiraceae bacterium]|nr:hypothetical protein [Oscillospiraceae bacterium]